MSAPASMNHGRRRVLALAAAGALVIAVAGCAGMGAGTGSPSQPFELRGASAAPVDGWIRADNSDAPGSAVWLAPRALVTAADVQRATAQKDAAGRAILLLQFTPEGSARLAAGTRELRGRQLAAVVEGRATNVATVQEPMGINTMALTGFRSLDEAARVAHRISERK